MGWRSIRQAQLEGRTVFLRLDLNVPLDEGTVADTTRIEAVLPTLGHCLRTGARVIAASHLGRPKGAPDPALSLEPVAERLQTLLGWPVTFCPDVVGERADRLRAELQDGDLLLIENLRFHPGETANDPGFARLLAKGCDLYATDAFAALHRAHASVVGVPRLLGGGYAGFLVERELEVLEALLREPARPFVLILGGAKISTKLPVLDHLLPRVDRVLLGGAMALTVLAARGERLGRSLVETEALESARELEAKAADHGVELVLPSDHRVRTADGAIQVRRPPLGEGDCSLDIGPETAAAFCDSIADAGTILWNGPLGHFEEEPFAAGTLEVGRAVADARGETIVGGGDSVAAINRLGLAPRIHHVSTGGGAMLAFLSGRTLPGIEAIS